MVERHQMPTGFNETVQARPRGRKVRPGAEREDADDDRREIETDPSGGRP